MATQEALVSVSRVAAADLSAKQYTFVKVDGDGKAAAASAAGEPVFGVLQNDPGTGEEATVAVGGISKVKADGVINEGDLIATSADGQAAVATKATVNTADAGVAADAVSGSYVIGIAVSAAAAAGEVVSVLLTHAGAVATTNA